MNRKLVVFVPREAVDPVREALFAAGAGRIGNYERCSWYAAGTGTFFGFRLAVFALLVAAGFFEGIRILLACAGAGRERRMPACGAARACR